MDLQYLSFSCKDCASHSCKPVLRTHLCWYVYFTDMYLFISLSHFHTVQITKIVWSKKSLEGLEIFSVSLSLKNPMKSIHGWFREENCADHCMQVHENRAGFWNPVGENRFWRMGRNMGFQNSCCPEGKGQFSAGWQPALRIIPVPWFLSRLSLLRWRD